MFVCILDQKKYLPKPQFLSYLQRIQNPSYEQTIENIQTTKRVIGEMNNLCTFQLHHINALSSGQRTNVDGRDGTFAMNSAKQAKLIHETAEFITNYLNELHEIATRHPGTATVNNTMRLLSFLTGSVENINALIATVSDDLTKDLKQYMFARGRIVEDIYNRMTNREYAARHNSNPIYNTRLHFREKLNKVTTLIVDSIFAELRQEYAKIKTNEDLLKQPAVKEALFFFYREQSETQRTNRKKPAGLPSFDFRSRATTILNRDTFFPQLDMSGPRTIIPSNEYIINVGSIALVYPEHGTGGIQDDPWWYILSSTSLRSNCSHERFIFTYIYK